MAEPTEIVRLPLHERWLASWDVALAALTSATLNGALTGDAAARHRTLITAERERVIGQLLSLVRWSGGEFGITVAQ